MRIVIDGAHGAGKTTFLNGNLNDPFLHCVLKSRATIFSDLIGDSFQEGEELNIVPPKNEQDYWKIFEIIMKRGSEQFARGEGRNICWYDRGVHFINVIAQMQNVTVPIDIQNKLNSITYDYVFVFDPIESYDFSNIHKHNCRSFSIHDRYESVVMTLESYKKAGNKVFRVPVFSYDLNENYVRRMQFIKDIIIS